MSDSFSRNVVWNGAIVGFLLRPWIEWQLAQVTSLVACRPDSQNARCRFVWWQLRQTADFSCGVPCLIRFAGLLATGSLRCSDASPWQAWHMLPFASFFAPCAVN